MIRWLIHFVETHEALAFGLSVFSVACFVGSILALPVLVARAPVDYFARECARQVQRPVGVRILRNFAGLVLLSMGVLMLVLPGQGLITILVSLSFLEIPAKQRLIRALGRRPGVAKGLQWLRTRSNKPPFEMD